MMFGIGYLRSVSILLQKKVVHFRKNNKSTHREDEK